MIMLTSAQEQIVEAKIAAGQYNSAEEMLDVALELLDFLDTESLDWLKQTQQKLQVGIEELEQGKGVDGEIAIEQFLQKF